VKTREEFCQELRDRIAAQGQQVVLRVAVSPEFETPVEFTGKEILRRADELASFFATSRKRSVVLVLLPHCPELFLLQLGLVLAGHVPAVLAWPTTRVDAEKYQRNLLHQLSHLPAGLLITLPNLAENIGGGLPYPACGIELENGAQFAKLFPGRPVGEQLECKKVGERRAGPSDEALFLQFSGGTTGAQKAVVVTAEMLITQLESLGDALQFRTDDAIASWLPLYHDMGLIACYWMPLWHGAASTQISANDWVINPELLLRYISRYNATLCWLPNFAFSYISQRRESMRQKQELNSIRAWINCSEPVRQKSMQEFAQAFEDWGVKKESLQASYAMAETVFAITQTKLGEEVTVIPRSEVKRGEQSCTELAFDVIDDVYVSSGRLLAGTEVRIVASDGAGCGERVAGEIWVCTPSLFSGYWGSEGFQTFTLKDGWHATGDYGFLSGGELFVIGRFKDIVIVGGNNIFPEDVESVVNSIEGVYPGRAVAFGVEDTEYGTQGLAVVAEMKGDFTEESASMLEAVIRKQVLTTIGTAARYVSVVPQRWIVKSTAGKISRGETRERFLREQLTGF
jgi:fatty-acyl-CoA synthase